MRTKLIEEITVKETAAAMNILRKRRNLMRPKLIDQIANQENAAAMKTLLDVFGDLTEDECTYMLIILRACYEYDQLLTKLDAYFRDNPRDEIHITNLHSVVLDNLEEQICEDRVYNLKAWLNLKGTVEANSLKESAAKKRRANHEEISSDDFCNTSDH